MHLLLAEFEAGPCCGLFFVLGVVAFVVFVSKLPSVQNDLDRIQQTGTPALGIVLRIDAIGTTVRGSWTTFSGMTASGASTTIKSSYQQKNAVIDVEIPGQPPYEATTSVLMPSNMEGDVLPGASVELRIDPKDKKKILIVGPGSGFAGFTQIPVTFQQDGST